MQTTMEFERISKEYTMLTSKVADYDKLNRTLNEANISLSRSLNEKKVLEDEIAVLKRESNFSIEKVTTEINEYRRQLNVFGE